MAALNITPNHEKWGYDIVMTMVGAGEVSDGVATLTKSYGGWVDSVRGFSGLNVVADTYSTIDVEVPLDIPVTYELRHNPAAAGPIFTAIVTVGPLVTEGLPEFVIRDLFSMNHSIVDDINVGTIQDEVSENRMGVFPIHGRSDPVVVIDQRQTTTSTLILLTKTDNQVAAVNRLVQTGTPMMLQSAVAYDLGTRGTPGLMYLAPGTVTKQRILPDGRMNMRRIEIEYTEISPPPAIVQFVPDANTYDEVLTTWGTYRAILDATWPTTTYFDLLYNV